MKKAAGHCPPVSLTPIGSPSTMFAMAVVRLVVLILMMFVAGDRAWAQSAPQTQPTQSPTDAQMRVFLITFGDGDEVWEKFGHTAIWIHDPGALPKDEDLAYNWGMFDDSKVSFYFRFFQGRLWYWMGHDSAESMMEFYAKELNRTVLLQELNLTTQQKIRIRQVLRRADTNANRFYRYDYYRDNCATRPRDVIDNLIDGRLRAGTEHAMTDTTFRSHTRRLTSGTIWLYTVLEAVMGHPVDRPLSEWDEMFLPMKLHDRVAEVKVPDPYGGAGMVPLVLQERLVYQSTRPPMPAQPPRLWPRFGMGGGALAILLLILGHFVRRHWAPRALFILLALPWVMLMGIGGVIILWGWGITDHAVARYNENVLHVSPLLLPLVIFLPKLALGRRTRARAARWLAVAAAGGSLLGLLLKVLPQFYQYNWDIIALTLPVNLAMAFIIWRLAVVVEARQARTTEGNGSGGRKMKATDLASGPT